MEDKTHYTINHILAYLRTIACIGFICWAAIELKTAWALWAIALCVGSYKHDFVYWPRKKSKQAENRQAENKIKNF